MTNSLTRLFEGIIETLSTDVVPYLNDAYARGQVWAAVDLLKMIAMRVELNREWLHQELAAQEHLLSALRELAPGVAARHEPDANGPSTPERSAPPERAASEQLLARMRRLEKALAETIRAFGWTAEAASRQVPEQAAALLDDYFKGWLEREIERTVVPRFSEISSGKGPSGSS